MCGAPMLVLLFLGLSRPQNIFISRQFVLSDGFWCIFCVFVLFCMVGFLVKHDIYYARIIRSIVDFFSFLTQYHNYLPTTGVSFFSNFLDSCFVFRE